MPDPDIDPPAGPFGGEAGIKTPWESIDPNEPARSAPESKQARPSKKRRRRAKAALAEHANPPVPSVSTTAKAVETDGVTEDPDEAFTVMAFLPDEHFALTELTTTADEPDDQPATISQEDADEPMVEIFLDRSENDSTVVADSEKHLTTSTAVVHQDQIEITENLDDALAEKAFFSDETIAPMILDEPAPKLETQSGESTDKDSPKPLVEYFADVSPEASISEIVAEAGVAPAPSTITYPSDVFSAVVEPPVVGQQTAIVPEIFATADDVDLATTITPTESSLPRSASPGSMRDSNEDSALTLTANSAAGALAGGLVAASRSSAGDGVGDNANLSISSQAISAPATIAGPQCGPYNSTPQPAMESDVSIAVQPEVIAATSPSQSSAPVAIADDVEMKPVRAPAAPIRYLRPKAGSLVRKPAAVLPVEIAEETELDPEPELDSISVTSGGGWTIPLMCLGIGLIACCVIIPQADLNRRLYYQRQALAGDLESIQKQVAVNDEFLKEVIDNPTLAERLASRQMKTIRKGQKVLAVRQVNDDGDMSPFALVAVPRPPAPTPYKPVIGTIANLCNDARSRLYLLGVSMTMVAVGLVLGFNPKKSVEL